MQEAIDRGRVADEQGPRARSQISNRTELDLWQCFARERLDVPSIHVSHQRQVFERDGMLLAVSPYLQLLPDEAPFAAAVRSCTVGDDVLHGGDPVHRVDGGRDHRRDRRHPITERGASRADDRFSEAAMEDRKREGHF